jgi:hypothetical protein
VTALAHPSHGMRGGSNAGRRHHVGVHDGPAGATTEKDPPCELPLVDLEAYPVAAELPFDRVAVAR